MKMKGISFTQVLEKKGKASRIISNPKIQSMKLCEMLQQYIDSPQQNYTLYLGTFGSSQRSKTSNKNLLFSNTPNDEKEEMFDSWIQKQQFQINKQNIERHQNRATNHYQQNIKQNHKNQFSQRTPEQTFQAKNKFQTLKPNNYYGNIQMINSNGPQNDNRSPRNLQLQFEEIQQKGNKKSYEQKQQKKQKYIYDNPQIKQNTRQISYRQNKQITKQGQNKKQIQLLNKKERQAQARRERQAQTRKERQIQNKREAIDHIIAQTDNIDQQIAEIANKYMTQSVSQQPKQLKKNISQDQQLLIDETDNYKQKNKQKQNLFSQQYNIKAKQAQDLQKKRRQYAKQQLQQFMSHNINKYQTKKQPIPQIKVNAPNNVCEVGYSFSSNMYQNSYGQCSQQNNKNNIQEIPHIVSELPSLKIQDSNDLCFKKYINEQPIVIPDQQIQNIQSIQSIQYEDKKNYWEEQQIEVQNNGRQQNTVKQSFSIQECSIPMVQSQFKSTIVSKLYTQTQPVYSNIHKQQNTKIYAKPQQIKYTIEDKHQQIKQIAKMQKPVIKRLTLVSSKNKNNSNKSQKQTPKAHNKPEQPQVKIQPFLPHSDVAVSVTYTASQPQQIIQKKQSSPFRSIKQVKQNIINSIKSPQVISKTQDTSTTSYVSPTYATTISPSYTSTYMNKQSLTSYYSNNQIKTHIPITKYTSPSTNNNQIKSYYNSPKTYEYPSGNTTTSNSNYQIKKVQYIPSSTNYQIKKVQYVPPKITTIQSKYSHPSDKLQNLQKNYLSNLDIKQSITVKQSQYKPIVIKQPEYKPTYVQPTYNTYSTTNYHKPLISGIELKKSITQSSSQFTFDL